MKKYKNKIKTFLPYVIVVVVVVLIRSFIITPAIVDGNSMNDTLQDNNVILLNKLDYRLNKIERFDIVVLKHNGDKLVKRIIGLPGEHIEYRNNNLYVDGFLVEENYAKENTNDFKLESVGYLNIPGDMYFVLGDNRNNSIDSRTFGLVKKENILGSVSLRIFPLNKISKVK